MRDHVASVAAIIIAAGVLAVPALWNGYPFVFFDTLDYLRMSFTWEFMHNRTMPYAVVLAATHLGLSTWLTVAFQCLVVAYVLYEALAVFAPVRPARALVPMALLLLVATGVGFYTGQLMPDVFAGVVALGSPTLALGAGRLPPWRRAALTVVVAIAASTHSSHLFLAIGLAACAVGFAAIGRWWPEVRRDAVLPVVAALGGAVLVVATHWVLAGRPVLSQSGSVFLLARFMQDGLAQRYLDDICPPLGQMATEGPAAGLRLCPVRDRLPMNTNQFLWNPYWNGNSPFIELGGWIGLRSEAQRVVVGTLKAYPAAHAAAALRETAIQLVMTGTGDGLENIQWLMNDEMRRSFPNEFDSFVHSRQEGEGHLDFGPVNAVHVPLLILATLATGLLVIPRLAGRDGRTSAMAAFLLLAILGNAFICGALSNPNHRYQSRVVWVAVFAVAVGAMRMREKREVS